MGGALGLGVLVTLAATAHPEGTGNGGAVLLAERVGTALTGGGVLLALALVAAVALVLPKEKQ